MKRAYAAVLVTLAAFLALLPIYWIVITSFKTIPETTLIPPTWYPREFTLANYLVQFSRLGPEYGLVLPSLRPSVPFVLNSVIVTLGATGLTLFVGTLTAYSISRFRTAVLPSSLAIAIDAVPAVTVAIPVLLMYNATGLLDQYLGLSLIHTAHGIGFTIWLLKSYFDEVPIEIEEAATIDGVSSLWGRLRVVLPSISAGLVVAALFAFVNSWSEFTFALILMNQRFPASVQIIAYTHEIGQLFGPRSALGLLISLPLFIFGYLLRKSLVTGFTLGALRTR